MATEQKATIDPRWRWPLIILAVIVGGYMYYNLNDSGDDEAVSAATYDVTYIVSGAGEINVSYDNNQNGENRDSILLSGNESWRETVRIDRGKSVRMAAFHNQNDAEIYCEIQVNGVTKDTARSEGDRVNVFCNATVGD